MTLKTIDSSLQYSVCESGEWRAYRLSRVESLMTVKAVDSSLHYSVCAADLIHAEDTGFWLRRMRSSGKLALPVELDGARQDSYFSVLHLTPTRTDITHCTTTPVVVYKVGALAEF